MIEEDLIGEAWPELVDLEFNPMPGYEDYCRRLTDLLRQLITVVDELAAIVDPPQEIVDLTEEGHG